MKFKYTPEEQADRLMSDMFQFIPLTSNDAKKEVLAAKYCARAAVRFILDFERSRVNSKEDKIQIEQYGMEILDCLDQAGTKKHSKVTTQIKFAVMLKEYINIPWRKFLQKKRAWRKINQFAKEHESCCGIKWENTK